MCSAEINVCNIHPLTGITHSVRHRAIVRLLFKFVSLRSKYAFVNGNGDDMFDLLHSFVSVNKLDLPYISEIQSGKRIGSLFETGERIDDTV